ncbi:site-specific integrase [Candidatus Poriferisodalis sp.]|uniref:site-specific integrase n=1 Tax=Candidatus Poriferisodalis sp. TaxID=3101277 RepID=UPI003B52F8BF
MADEEDLSPNTIRAYIADARTLERFLGGASPVAEFGPADIERFAEHLLASGLKRNSTKRRFLRLPPATCICRPGLRTTGTPGGDLRTCSSAQVRLVAARQSLPPRCWPSALEVRQSSRTAARRDRPA